FPRILLYGMQREIRSMQRRRAVRLYGNREDILLRSLPPVCAHTRLLHGASERSAHGAARDEAHKNMLSTIPADHPQASALASAGALDSRREVQLRTIPPVVCRRMPGCPSVRQKPPSCVRHAYCLYPFASPIESARAATTYTSSPRKLRVGQRELQDQASSCW